MNRPTDAQIRALAHITAQEMQRVLVEHENREHHRLICEMDQLETHVHNLEVALRQLAAATGHADMEMPS